MNAPETKIILNRPAAAAIGARPDPSQDDDYRLICIATVALNKAKGRGYGPGYERQDWIEAEAEVLAQLYGMAGTGC
jgi:hypothetical protein